MATSPDTTQYYTRQYAGLGSVSSYQVSGVPFVTGSGITPVNTGMGQAVSFPRVTKSITLLPTADQIKLAFVPTGSSTKVATDHSISFPSTGTPAITLDVKCSEVHIFNVGAQTTQGWTIYASLTGIDQQAMFPLTGSGLTE
jgi:hypothetical protein